jgi:hypothetical protein
VLDRNTHYYELQYLMVEGTFSVLPPIKTLDTLSPPGTSKHKPTANPSLSASTLSSARLLEYFTCWAAKTNLKLKRSSSGECLDYTHGII